jgi:hypothetical protein
VPAEQGFRVWGLGFGVWGLGLGFSLVPAEQPSSEETRCCA